MESLKKKAIKSFNWSLFEGFSSQGITFVVGIVLARILSPSDFGLVGLITVFVVVSNSIVESGLSNALIRKTDATNKDFSTVFFINITLAAFIYVLFFLISSFISDFFNEPRLKNLIRVSTIALVINSWVIIQRTLLVKDLNFKLQSIISFIASFFSGLIAVIMVYNKFGVWSLVFLTISKQLINCILLWVTSKWRPIMVFSKSSFNELFDYGYKLLIANLINSIYQNIYYVIIGKVFTPTSLGYFTRADSFQKPFSSNIALGIRRISFPILSGLQNDDFQLKMKFKKFIRFSILLSSIVLFCIAGIAKPIVLILVGEKWFPSIFYLKLLCVPGILYPLQILNLNLLNIKGFSNLNLKLEIVKKIVLIPVLFIVTFKGIDALLYSLVVFSIVEFFINSIYTYKLINYSLMEQLKDIFPFILISIISFFLVSIITLFDLNSIFTIVIQMFVMFFYYALIVMFSEISEFKEIKNIIYLRIRKI